MNLGVHFVNKMGNEKENKEKTWCSNCGSNFGCKKMTISILHEDGTHYYCKECGAIK